MGDPAEQLNLLWANTTFTTTIKFKKNYPLIHYSLFTIPSLIPTIGTKFINMQLSETYQINEREIRKPKALGIDYPAAIIPVNASATEKKENYKRTK